jgi:hypothetical protein
MVIELVKVFNEKSCILFLEIHHPNPPVVLGLQIANEGLGAPLRMLFEHPFPTKRTVLPLLMHAIYAYQHTRKPPLFVDAQEAGSVFGGRLS